MGHPTACAAALAVQQVIEADGLLQRVNELSKSLFARLQDRFHDNEYVGDIRGRGLLIGLEVVRERQIKKPFQVASNLHGLLKKNAFDLGLLCYPMAGTVDGVNGHHILLAPPFTLQEAHLDELVDKLGSAFDVTIKQILSKAK